MDGTANASRRGQLLLKGKLQVSRKEGNWGAAGGLATSQHFPGKRTDEKQAAQEQVQGLSGKEICSGKEEAASGGEEEEDRWDGEMKGRAR